MHGLDADCSTESEQEGEGGGESRGGHGESPLDSSRARGARDSFDGRQLLALSPDTLGGFRGLTSLYREAEATALAGALSDAGTQRARDDDSPPASRATSSDKAESPFKRKKDEDAD